MTLFISNIRRNVLNFSPMKLNLTYTSFFKKIIENGIRGTVLKISNNFIDKIGK